jgi:surface antigen
MKQLGSRVAMHSWGTNTKSLIFGSFLALSYQIAAPSADASPGQQQRQRPETAYERYAAAKYRGKTVLRGQYAHGGLSCVPFARSDSGIAVTGNAWQWWANAAGVYARGSVPEPGSVLTFRSNGRMRLGHVAVVSRVINPREVEIEHANWWGPGMNGGVARNIPVVDVSEANDWTAVRVGLGQPGHFGSVYPTYGFIYDRPDTGVLVAATGTPAPQPELNPVPSDLRPRTERGWQTYEEVAQAPAGRTTHSASGQVHRVATLTDRKE